MRRFAALAAIPVLAGVPLTIATTWAVGVVTAASVVVGVMAVRRASLQSATTGGTLAVIALALALRSAPAAPHLMVMALFGLALLLLVDGVSFHARFDGAAIVWAWWWRRLAWCTARAAVALGVAIAVASLAPLIALALPQLWGPLLAGVGVLAAFAAALAFARPGG